LSVETPPDVLTVQFVRCPVPSGNKSGSSCVGVILSSRRVSLILVDGRWIKAELRRRDNQRAMMGPLANRDKNGFAIDQGV
jgi:hypothetical protein